MSNQVAVLPICADYDTVSKDLSSYSLEAPCASPTASNDIPLKISSSSESYIVPDVFHITILDQHLLVDVGTMWFDRIHIVPNVIVLGNLISSQTYNIEIWNAFLHESKTLDHVDETNTEGMSMALPGALPLTFAPNQVHISVLDVTVDGPPSIDGEYSFVFNIYPVSVSITGKRIVVFPLVPQAEFTESLEWLTDLVKTKAAEQRICLRNLPRQSVSMKYQLTETQFSLIKNISAGWVDRSFCVPMWSDMEDVGMINSGAMTLSVNCEIADYAIGELALIYQDEYTFEASEVIDVQANGLTLKLPVVQTYQAAYVMPTMVARALDGVSFRRSADYFISASATFTSTKTRDLSLSQEAQWQGEDLILRRSVYVSDISEKILRSSRKLDSQLGPIVLDPLYTYFEHTSSMTFSTLTRDELFAARRWIHSRKGRQKAFYIPTWNNDFELLDPLVTSSTSIRHKKINNNLYYSSSSIIILKKDGTGIPLLTSGSALNLDGSETTYFQSQVGEDLSLEDIDRVSFITHVRLAADRIEIKHKTNREATIVIPIAKVPV